MATGSILLWPGAITLPDGSANNGFATAQIVKSSSLAVANVPNVYFDELLFDPAADESVLFSFRMPGDFSSAPIVKVQFRANQGDVTKAVAWKSAIVAVNVGGAPGSAAFEDPAIEYSSLSAAANVLREASISLIGPALDGLSGGGQLVCLLLGRDADDAGDTCTVDAGVLAVSLEYQT